MTCGIDISRWQREPFDWAAEKARGTEFMFAKASQARFKDPLYKSHIAAAKSHGILTGSYHYVQPSVDIKAQVETFLAAVEPTDLPLAMDFEVAEGRPAAVLRECAWAFLNEIEQRTGKTPLFYSYLSFINSMALDSRFAHFPLWLAEYNGRSAPSLIPGPWHTWTFWQSTGTGLDRDQFNGTFDELKLLVG